MEIIKPTKGATKRAAEVILAGGLVVFPSDTVYILAVDPTNQKAVDKLLAFKNRWAGKAISIAVADEKMAQDYVELSPTGRNIYKTLLPGPFTVVSAGKHRVAKEIEAENGTLGVRIPDYKFIHDLVRLIGGPITATSANLSGRTPHYSIESFLRTLSEKKKGIVDLIVDGGKLPRNKPSTVIDTTEPEIKVLRWGDLIVGKGEKLISKSEGETGKIAEFLLARLLSRCATPTWQKPLVFGLSGDLGCGKTVFAGAMGRKLGIKEKITSPTFVIFNEYKINYQLRITNYEFRRFLHFDLYRLTAEYEYEEIRFLEQFGPPAGGDAIACIEWPENMGQELMKKLKKMVTYVPVSFEYVDDHTRQISWKI